MKKKSFLSGFNAKIALTIVALSGALLTGCYKDEGLDVNTPGGSVTIPAATYTLTGTVINAEGALMKDATISVTPNTKFEASGASFTAAVAPGSVTIKAIPSAADKALGYKEVEKKINVVAVAAGQAAVYTETIVLTKDAPVPPAEKVDAKYDVEVVVFGASDLNTPLAKEAYALKVTDGAGAEVKNFKGLAAGMYNVVVTPTDAAKYNAYTTALNLATVKVEEGASNIAIKVYGVLTEKAAQKEYRVLSAFVNLQDDNVKLINIQIVRNGEPIATSNANYIVYLDEKVAGAVYKLVINYTDDGDVKKTVRTFTDSVIAFPIVLKHNDTSTELDGKPLEENLEEVLDKETSLLLPKGLTAKLNGENYAGVFNLDRIVNQETPGTLRAYEGTPNGLEFTPAVQIRFNDVWNKELGKLELKYWDATVNKWIVDAKGGSVIEEEGKYIMNVAHFSKFKAEIIATESNTSKVEVVSTETTVGKKNDTEKIANKDFTYSYAEGMAISDVKAAVKAAGFNNEKAILAISNYIEDQLLVNFGIINSGIKDTTVTTEIAVAPWTCLESIVKKQTTTISTFNFTINGKVVTVITTVPNSAELTTSTYTFGHGHGHSHGHGHGDDLNAGGGIVEAE